MRPGKIKTLIWLMGLLLLAIVISVPSGPAEAISCGAGNTCIEHLTNTNIFSAVPGDITIDIQVTVNNTGATTVLTVAFISDNIVNTPLGIDQFGYDSAVAASILPAGWNQANCPPQGCQMGGFGSFASEIDNPGGTDLLFSFTLASLVTVFGPNANGAEFAAHIRFDGGCSSFVSDGTAAQTQSNTCIPSRPPVPAPATLLLVGSTMVGFGAWRLGRRKS